MSDIVLNRVDFDKYKEKIGSLIGDETIGLRIIEYLENHKEILSEMEFIKTRIEMPEIPPGVMAFMVPNTKYFVNLKLATITLALLFLDIKLTAGAASSLGSMLGVTGKSIAVVTEEEKCIILDIANRKHYEPRQIDYEGQECTRNDLFCKFRKSGNCTRTLENIVESVTNLKEKSVVIKSGMNFRLEL